MGLLDDPDTRMKVATALFENPQQPKPSRLKGILDLVAPALMGSMASGGVPMAPPKDTQSGLDQFAMQTMLVPGLGDAAGLAADAHMYATDPASRTWGNYAMSAAGMLPFVPGVASAARTASKAAGVLPMDEASRMARADEMGHTVDALHGRAGDYDRVNIPYGRNGNTDTGSVGRGFYAAPSTNEGANTASTYAQMASYRLPDGQANVMPLRLRLNNPLRITSGAEGRLGEVQRLSTEWGIEVPKDRGDWLRGGESGFWADDFTSELRKRGHDGVIVETPSGAPVEYMVIDPSQVRSRFAAFDPAKKDSSDILAAVGPLAGLLGLAGYGATRDREQD